MPDISITLPADIENKIKMLAAGVHMDKSAVIKSIIDAGVRQKMIGIRIESVFGKEGLPGKSGRGRRHLDPADA